MHAAFANDITDACLLCNADRWLAIAALLYLLLLNSPYGGDSCQMDARTNKQCMS